MSIKFKVSRLTQVSRFTHKWLAIFTAVPFAIILTTGLLLSLSSRVSWLQPKPVIKSPSQLTLSFDDILRIGKTVPEAEISSWADIAQIDARPKEGVVRIRAKNYWEIQINGETGQILSSAKRWKTFLIVLHDGSWFGSLVRYGIFWPTAFSVLILWITGLILFVCPWLKKKKAKV